MSVILDVFTSKVLRVIEVDWEIANWNASSNQYHEQSI